MDNNSLFKYITLTEKNIDKEHICCAFSDKKCSAGYELKKEWLKKEFANGYVFRRLDARAKVFIEYVPAEYAWLPVTAPGYLMIYCFWVSGQYKGQGHGYKEYGASLGFGLPLVDNRSYLNLSFEYVKVHPEMKTMIDEQYFRFTLNYCFNEFWFFKRKVN